MSETCSKCPTWEDVPNAPGTWFQYYRSTFQSYDYFVFGPRGLEYARVPGHPAPNQCDRFRWFGPIPLDPQAEEEISKRDVK